MSDDIYPRLVIAILKGQEEIIGPIAWQQASSVPGLQVVSQSDVTVSGADKAQIIENLVARFGDFFGQAAVEICKEAAHKVSGITIDDLPPSLR